MPTFHQTYQLQILTGQTQSFLDIPTHDTKQLQFVGLSTTATHSVTNVVLNDIATVVESNGCIVKPVQNGKPDVALLPGSTLRIISSRMTPSPDPVRVAVNIDLVELG